MMDMRHTVNEAVALQKIGTAKAVRGRKIFCVYGEKSSLIRTRYV